MKSVIKPIINLKARGNSRSIRGLVKVGGNPGLLASKQSSRSEFKQKELKRQVDLRQRLERTKNAGVDQAAQEVLDTKTKQVENRIGLLQKKISY